MIEIGLIIIVFGTLIFLGNKAFRKGELGFDQRLIVDLINRCLAKENENNRLKMKTLRSHEGSI